MNRCALTSSDNPCMNICDPTSPPLPPPLPFLVGAGPFHTETSTSGRLSLPHLSFILPLCFSSFRSVSSLLSPSICLPIFTCPPPWSPTIPVPLSSCYVVGLQLVLRGMSEALIDRRAAPALITLCSGPELWVKRHKNLSENIVISGLCPFNKILPWWSLLWLLRPHVWQKNMHWLSLVVTRKAK